MPFIGQQPVTGAYHKLDAITASATATYNLQLNGGAYSPASANHLLVSLNGVIQAPQDSFTVSGSTITFASALTSSDSIDFIMAYGDVLNIGTPSDGSVNTSQLANSAVTDAKIVGMSSSKLTGALPAIDGSALTGVVTPIAAGDVLQYVSTQANTYSGTQINWDSGAIVETTAYNSASLTPLTTLSITTKRANSKLVIDLIGRANINSGYRSQIALADTYTAGAYSTSNNLYYAHYGLYNNTGGDTYHGLAYRVYDTRSNAAGTTKTFYWFGGSIGGGTQSYWNLNMSITEVAT